MTTLTTPPPDGTDIPPVPDVEPDPGTVRGPDAVPVPAASSAVGRLARAMGRLSPLRVWAVVAVVYSAAAGIFFASGAAFAIPTVQRLCGEPPPDMRFGSTAGEVHGFLSACGPAGRAAYTALQLADLVYPLLFAIFIASSLALVLRLLAPHRPGLLAVAALPFAASGFDYLENVCAWVALAAWPEPGVADGLLGLASTAKTVTSWAAGGLLVVALVMLGVAGARRMWARRGRDLAAGGRA